MSKLTVKMKTTFPKKLDNQRNGGATASALLVYIAVFHYGVHRISVSFSAVISMVVAKEL